MNEDKERYILIEECYDLFRSAARKKESKKEMITICLLGVKIGLQKLENFSLVADIGKKLQEIYADQNLGIFFEALGCIKMNNINYKILWEKF
jgi:hypothetical protein